MAKQIVVLVVIILLFLVGIADVCVGHIKDDQVLLYAGIVFMVVAFLFSFSISRKKKD